MSKKDLERILFVPDTHRPYHCRKSWRVMMAAAKKFQPDTIVILGDFVDCYTLSNHRKRKPSALEFFDEIADAKCGLDDLDALGAKKKVYIEGNHEDRLTRYVVDNAGALWGAVTIPELLDLRERGWRWVPYGETHRIGKLNVTHDVGHAGEGALKPTQLAYGGQSVVIGHTHRMGYMGTGDMDGNTQLAAMFGWLGDKKAAQEYMHSAKIARYFPNGFGLGYRDSAGFVHLVPTPIVRGRCVVEGEMVRP